MVIGNLDAFVYPIMMPLQSNAQKKVQKQILIYEEKKLLRTVFFFFVLLKESFALTREKYNNKFWYYNEKGHSFSEWFSVFAIEVYTTINGTNKLEGFRLGKLNEICSALIPIKCSLFSPRTMVCMCCGWIFWIISKKDIPFCVCHCLHRNGKVTLKGCSSSINHD